MAIAYSTTKDITIEQILPVYQANKWSSANVPKTLHQALLNSHSLVTAWDGKKLVGIGNAISDGFLVVYYPHLLVHLDYQRRGIGKEIMNILQQQYRGFHMQILVAEREAIAFYQKFGFTKAGKTESMWIYEGNDY